MFNHFLKKTVVYSIVLMVMTSIHHIYGAWRYDTPWRLHVLLISVPVIIITALLYRMVKKQGSARVLFWLFWIVTLVPSLAMIGLFEGVYNHVLKNILYFTGTGRDVLDKLYQPGVYELPNDFIFEFTGILQGAIVVPLIVFFVRLTVAYRFLVISPK
jgi:hypothetical protein